MKNNRKYEDFNNQWHDIKAKVAVFYVNLVILPIAKYITFLFLQLRVTPNAISLLSSFLIIISSSLLMIDSSMYISLIFILLSQISYILDHCDGAVARIKDTSSKFGALLDVSLDRLNVMFLFLSIGIVSLKHDAYSPIYIFLFALASIIYIFYQFVSSIQPHYFPQMKGYMKKKDDLNFINLSVKVIYELVDTGIMYLIIGVSVIFNFQYWIVLFYGFLGLILTGGMVFVLYLSENKGINNYGRIRKNKRSL